MELSSKAALLLVAIVLGLLFLPLPEYGRLGVALQDLAHVPIGALLALMFWGQLRNRFLLGTGPATFLAFVFTAVVLVIVEFSQPFFGREQSMQDLHSGVLAAAGTLAIVMAQGSVGLSWMLGWLVGLFLVAVAAWPGGRILGDYVRQRRAAPLLASFEDDLEMTRWWFQDAVATRSPQHATHALSSLRVDLQPGPYPAATLAEPYPDWRGRRTFAFDAYLETGESLEVIVKIVDTAHDDTYEDRFNGYVTLHPGPNTVRIPMDEIVSGPESRNLDLEHIASVQILVDGLREQSTLYLDHVRLAGTGR